MIDFSKNADGLIPAVIQDAESLKVLMLGYMDKAAYEKTVETGLVTFFSRSRQTQWVKGETSGNFLHVVEIFPDCDADTLLIKARPDGPTCHRGTVSCFDTPDAEGFIRSLQGVVQGRHAEMPEGSYTTHLFRKGVKKIAQKVGEETTEAIIEAIAGDRSAYIYEVSDLLYHLLVLNEQMGVSLADLEAELRDRHA
ncbi:MAG: bifunctional phosphoribosyl-AMP cyclohydrolase/phosphoribosyl-ATP diphosphatase HisIE [Bacteroidales bacterium]|nr:bifunctional phosphoribosyl-AMP cyclohydrolase/phosphoribosyl-ATP diphosphatase HisIE [Bacteroidales bacterium]